MFPRCRVASRLRVLARSPRVSVRNRFATHVAFVACLVATLVVPFSLTTHASGQPSVKLVYFYTPPTDGTTPTQMAASADMVILGQNTTYLKQLRNANYSGLALQYVLAGEIEGPGPYRNASAACDTSYDPLSNQVADEIGDF